MKVPYYLRYFYFIGANWNYKLALFTIRHEIKGEKKYNINTIELNRLQHLKIDSDNLVHSSIYQAANYFLIEQAFDYLRSVAANNDIVDFGSGRGRAMVVAAAYGFRRITGIEFAKVLCVSAERNIQRVQSNYPSSQFKVICDDAINYLINEDDSVFYFFNPFDDVVILQVIKNILKSLKKRPRKAYIVYLNPVHKEIFLSAGFEEEYYLRKMQYLELSIMSNEED